MVKEAFVQYEMTEVSSSDPQTESMLQMMKGSTIDIYFNEKQQRTDIDMMGVMMKMQTFTGLDGEAPNAMYMDMMGRKLKIPMTDAEMELAKSLCSNRSFLPIAMELAYLCRLRSQEVIRLLRSAIGTCSGKVTPRPGSPRRSTPRR